MQTARGLADCRAAWQIRKTCAQPTYRPCRDRKQSDTGITGDERGNGAVGATVTTNVTLHQGHDVAYFTSGQHRGGCAGAMSYYTAAGEPPGSGPGRALRRSGWPAKSTRP